MATVPRVSTSSSAPPTGSNPLGSIQKRLAISGSFLLFGTPYALTFLLRRYTNMAKAEAIRSRGNTASPMGACEPPCPGVVISMSSSSIVALRGPLAGAYEAPLYEAVPSSPSIGVALYALPDPTNVLVDWKVAAGAATCIPRW